MIKKSIDEAHTINKKKPRRMELNIRTKIPTDTSQNMIFNGLVNKILLNTSATN